MGGARQKPCRGNASKSCALQGFAGGSASKSRPTSTRQGPTNQHTPRLDQPAHGCDRRHPPRSPPQHRLPSFGGLARGRAAGWQGGSGLARGRAGWQGGGVAQCAPRTHRFMVCNISPCCRDPGLNRGPSDLQSGALPTELSRLLLQQVIVSLVRIQPSEADFRTCGLAELLKKQEPFLSLATSPQVLPHFHKWREAHSRAPRRQLRRGGGSGLADLLSRIKKRAPSSFRLSASPQVCPSPRGGKLRSPGDYIGQQL